jgi:uncharacterized PurR-regulated membrane protein YhhQ (DUF165 family)
MARRDTRLGYLWFALYVGVIAAANWAIGYFGFVTVTPWGWTAPAGALFAGFAFTFRDLTQETLGKAASYIAILVGAALSYFLSDGRIAMASGLAFLLSETADFAVYTPLRKRGWLRAVALSNIVGQVVDSALFLTLAFGSIAFLPGQVLAKWYTTAAAIFLLWFIREWRRTAEVLEEFADEVAGYD